jgi:MraZ protein
VTAGELLVGEFTRTLDDRFRLTLPSELGANLESPGGECLLAKERLGCLSLWRPETWRRQLDEGLRLVQAKVAAGRLEGRLSDVQAFGRLLSTRHRSVPLAGRSRLVIPDGFREFLGVDPGGIVVVVGAAVCVELWNPEQWREFISEQMPNFRQLFDELSA